MTQSKRVYCLLRVLIMRHLILQKLVQPMPLLHKKKIMTHKYIALYTQPEVWADWRRTDIPKLTPNTGASVAFVPRRYPTALTERLYNTKAVVVSKLDEKVWWDK